MLFTESGNRKLKAVDRDTIRFASHDIEEKLQQLCAYLAPEENFPRSYVDDTVEELRVLGPALTTALFGDSVSAVRSEILKNRVQRIEFNVPEFDFNIPLEFAVFTDNEGKPFFLGDLCAVIRRAVLDNDVVASDASDETVELMVGELTGPWVAGYAEDDGLGSACVKHSEPGREDVEEIFALAPITSISDIDHLPPLDEDQLKRERLAKWLSVRKDVLHFNSHQVAIGGRQKKNARVALRVRNGALLDNSDFSLPQSTGFEEKTFFFLNACSSAYGPTDFRNSLPGKLMNLQAAAVICTIGPVQDQVGTLFAKEFYKLFEDGNLTVLEAMLAARQAVNESEGHPLANMYTLVGRPDFNLRSVTKLQIGL